MNLGVVTDVDWTMCTYDNSVSLGFLADRLSRHFWMLNRDHCYTWLMNQLVVLMGNVHGDEARQAEERRVHDVFDRCISLGIAGIKPPAAQWSHVCRAGAFLEASGYTLTNKIVHELVRVEVEMFTLSARCNGLYPDAAETVRQLREELGARVIALTTSDVRIKSDSLLHRPTFDMAHSRTCKFGRLGLQGLYNVIPRADVIVAELGKSHSSTHVEVMSRFADIPEPRVIVKIGDTHTDMELKFADERIFVVRQLRADGSFVRPVLATHVVHELAEVVPYLAKLVATQTV